MNPQLGTFVMDTHNPDPQISMSPFDYRIYDYHAEYRIKIKLICRLTKDPDQALISTSTIQEFPALILDKKKLCYVNFKIC